MEIKITKANNGYIVSDENDTEVIEFGTDDIETHEDALVNVLYMVGAWAGFVKDENDEKFYKLYFKTKTYFKIKSYINAIKMFYIKKKKWFSICFLY